MKRRKKETERTTEEQMSWKNEGYSLERSPHKLWSADVEEGLLMRTVKRATRAICYSRLKELQEPPEG